MNMKTSRLGHPSKAVWGPEELELLTKYFSDDKNRDGSLWVKEQMEKVKKMKTLDRQNLRREYIANGGKRRRWPINLNSF